MGRNGGPARPRHAVASVRRNEEIDGLPRSRLRRSATTVHKWEAQAAKVSAAASIFDSSRRTYSLGYGENQSSRPDQWRQVYVISQTSQTVDGIKRQTCLSNSLFGLNGSFGTFVPSHRESTQRDDSRRIGRAETYRDPTTVLIATSDLAKVPHRSVWTNWCQQTAIWKSCHCGYL